MAIKLRQTNLEKLREQDFDVLILGGGINGAVAAASLAGRGVRVALIDQGDFASGVSSNSSNLAWGGIKYLESHELAAWISIMDHPFFDITAEDGQFSLDKIPKGHYTIEAWHEKLGTLTESVNVTPGSLDDINFTFSKP